MTAAIDQNLNKDTEQARLEEEMRKRRERIELVSRIWDRFGGYSFTIGVPPYRGQNIGLKY